MDAKIQQTAAELLNLPSEERAYLADVLVESLDDFATAKLEDAWSLEVAGRLHEIETGQVEGIPSEQVHEELRRLLDETDHLPPAGAK